MGETLEALKRASEIIRSAVAGRDPEEEMILVSERKLKEFFLKVTGQVVENAVQTERARCLRIVEEALDRAPCFSVDHVDVPDLLLVQQAIRQRIESGG